MSDSAANPQEPNRLLTGAIDALASGRDLEPGQAAEALDEIMSGRASQIETAAFLIALRTKGETTSELVGLARSMRSHSVPVKSGRPALVDTAGTGGGTPTFNVSTTAAFVATGAGCAVAKHGNRSATGTSGSADLLEALGARIDLGPEAVAQAIDKVGFGFMFAPIYHPAMRFLVPVRKALAVRTVFNFLGPLTNPAGATRQLIGVSDAGFLRTMAEALSQLGAVHALVVCGMEQIDEMSASGSTHVIEVRGTDVTERDVTPGDFGLDHVDSTHFSAGTPQENAGVTRRIFSGDDCPERILTVINAAAAIYVGGEAESLEEGARKAEQSIDSGAAQKSLDAYVKMSQELSAQS